MIVHKFMLVLFGLIVCISCESNDTISSKETISTIEDSVIVVDIPAITVHDSLTELVRNTGVLMVEHQPFSGYVVDYFDNQPPIANGIMKSKSTYFEGKRHGAREHWYEDGQQQSVATYYKGLLNGQAKSWWQNGNQRAYNEYKNGHLHGVAKQWYKEGMLYKQLNYENGKEVGLQRAWRKMGFYMQTIL